MSLPGICSFCYDGIIRAKVSWDYHHPSYTSLARSAHQRCYFCSLLSVDVDKHRKELEKFATANQTADNTLQYWLPSEHKHSKKPAAPKDKQTALYRWSVRSLGRTRESNFVLAITFRVIPQSPASQDDNSPETNLYTFNLPERVFYCFPEDDLGPLLSSINLGRSTNPEANEGYQIKSWIRHCGIEHAHCPKRAGAGSKFVPTRLLHVGGKRRDRFRVLDTKANKIKGPYVTLSHCWGETEGVRRDTLRSDSLEEFMNEGVPRGYLSRTFREAVEVARFLEVDYIWIDSLCIIQGSDEAAKQDWNHEGSLMHKVYRNSYCNIAAADAKDSTQGLFRKREPRDVFAAKFESNSSGNIFGERVWRVLREDLWENDLLKRPLYTRGWVFQERMLAPRILHFSHHQIFWDCTEVSACETVPEGLPPALDRQSATDRHWRGRLQESGTNAAIMMSAVNDDSPEDFWRMAVENYTNLNLKFQTDKRKAIWGIAKLVRDSLNTDYVAGMWDTNLGEQLAWRVADSTTAERPKVLKINPSWSWQSVKGRILIEGRSEEGERAYQVTNHQGQPLSFQTGDRPSRPELTRDPSETFEEGVLAMGRRMELVEERRRKSSASSRKASQSDYPASRQNSRAGLPPSRQNSGFTALREPQDSQPNFDKADPRKNMFFEQGTMSPQQIPVEDDEDQASGLTTRKNSEVDIMRTRDIEPEVGDRRIAIAGQIHEGFMMLSGTGRWMIDITSTSRCHPDEIIIDAYPDVKRNTDNDVVMFVILALSQQFEQNETLYFSTEPAAAPKSWYTGSGIMLQQTVERNCFVRTGAIDIRYLSTEAWMMLKAGKEHDIANYQSEREPAKFFLV